MLERITDYLTLFLAMGIINSHITTSHICDINNITIYTYKIIIIIMTRLDGFHCIRYKII